MANLLQTSIGTCISTPIVCATSKVRVGNVDFSNPWDTRLKLCGSGDNYMILGPANDNGWGYIESVNNSSGIYFGTNQGGFSFDTGHLKSYTDGEVDIGTSGNRFRCAFFRCSIKTYGSGRQDIWVGSTDNNAGIWLDGSNGDFSGSDYAWIRHNNDKSFEITLDAAAGGLFNINNQSNTDMNFRTNGALRFVIEAGGNTRSCHKHFACTCIQSPIVCGTTCLATNVLAGGGSAASDYGAIQITGAKGGYGGFHSCGYTFMAQSNCGSGGIYNDTHNQWVIWSSANSSTYLYNAGAAVLQTNVNGIRVCKASNAGYIDICPAGAWGHIITDNNCFYFNKPITVDSGRISSYNEDLILHRGYSETAAESIKITSGTTHICQQTLVCTSLQSPIVCGTTHVHSALICGSSWVCSGGTICGATLCAGVVCGTTCLDGKKTILDTSGNYAWCATDTAGSYSPIGLRTSFVRSAQGWPEYGTVLHVGGRGGNDAGGDFQLYMGHGHNYGGIHLQVRSANNDASPSDSWTTWKTLLDSCNISCGGATHVCGTTLVQGGMVCGSTCVYAEVLRVNSCVMLAGGGSRIWVNNRRQLEGSADGAVTQIGEDFTCTRLHGLVYACTCIQSPIVCATTFVCAANICSTAEVYLTNWVRSAGTAGMYWPNSSLMHLYPQDAHNLLLRSNCSNVSLVLSTCNNTTPRGYFYGSCDNHVGILDYNGNWRVQVVGTSTIWLKNPTCICGGGGTLEVQTCVKSPIVCATSHVVAPVFYGTTCGNVELGSYVGVVKWPHCTAQSGSRTFQLASNQGVWGNLVLAMSDANDTTVECKMIDIRNNLITVCKALCATTCVKSPIVCATNQICSDGNLTVKGNVIYHCGGSPEFRWGTASTHVNWRMAVQETISNAWEIGSGLVDADVSNDTFTRHLWVGTNYICGSCCFTAPVVCATTCVRAHNTVEAVNNAYFLSGPNSTWGCYLVIGGNGNNSSHATVATTNGNLHLDAKPGNGLYLNWYANAGGINSCGAFLNCNCFHAPVVCATSYARVNGCMLFDQGYGHGAYGLYNSTKYQHVWSMGTAYKQCADGTGLGSLYGLAYTHTNVGGESKAGLSHQLLFVHNGSTHSAVGSGMWTCGVSCSTNCFKAPTVCATGSMHTPIIHATTRVCSPTYCATNDYYVQGWFRNNQSAHGMYNQCTGQHFYSDDARYWNIGGGNGEQGLRFRDTHASNLRGGIYADTSNNLGLKDSAGYWTYRTQRNGNQEWKISDTTYLCLSTACLCAAGNICGQCFYGLGMCSSQCVQTPIVCATNYIRIGASGSYICQAASGDLEIKSAGGDLDIITWLRMRASTNSTIKSSWSHSTGHMHIGGDTSNAAQDYAMKVSVVGSAGSICGAGCIRSASHICGTHIYGTTYMYAPSVCGNELSVSNGSDNNGIAIGQPYANNGSWNSQLNMYGAAHVMARWCKSSGTTGDDAQYGCIWLHNSHPLTMTSSGNMRICTAGTVKLCLTSTLTCVTGCLGITSIANQARTVPTKFFASNDNFVRYHDRCHFKGLLGLTSKYQCSRTEITADPNYWTGSMGWAAQCFNTVGTWGSGFFDVWSNPGQQPSGTSHWVGTQAMHYSASETTTYGWQMAVGAGSPALTFMRGNWGSGWSSWYKMWNEANDGAGSGLDADKLDGQQGSYYLSATGKAADSDLLDGLNSTAYLKDDGWNTSPGQDANTQGGMSSDFTYSNNAPHTGELIRFGAGSYSIQLNAQYGGTGDNISFRTRNGDSASWNGWNALYHDDSPAVCVPTICATGTSGYTMRTAGCIYSNSTIVAAGDVYGVSVCATNYVQATNYVYAAGSRLGSSNLFCGATCIHADADSKITFKNAGTNAIAMYADAGDELYLASNNAASGTVRIPSAGGIDASSGCIKGPIGIFTSCVVPGGNGSGCLGASGAYWGKVYTECVAVNGHITLATGGTCVTAPIVCASATSGYALRTNGCIYANNSIVSAGNLYGVLTCGTTCVETPVVCATTCVRTSYLTAQYNSTTSYIGAMCWQKLQLGNNGANEMRAGHVACGGMFKFYTNNTAAINAVTNGVLTMEMCKDGTVRTNIGNNCGGLRSGNLSLGYGASYNTLCNVASGQQLHLRTTGNANIQINDSGSGKTYICNCVQSPIVCATSCVHSPVFRAPNAACLCSQLTAGQLYMLSCGGVPGFLGGDTRIQLRVMNAAASADVGYTKFTTDSTANFGISVNTGSSIIHRLCISTAGVVTAPHCFTTPISCATTCFSLSSGSNVTKICNSVGFTVVDSTEGLLVRDNSANVMEIRASGTKSYCNFNVCGSLSKASGCFSIPHPDPSKNSTHNLQHSFVESPTEGDNIYRWQVDTSNCASVITLPSYYRHLNKNDMVWVSPYKNFGAAYGEVTADQCCLIVCSNQDGCYNVLLIGTRKDEHAENTWTGPEVLKPTSSETGVPTPVHSSQL